MPTDKLEDTCLLKCKERKRVEKYQEKWRPSHGETS
jgi:hypothetical protein